MRVRCHNTSGPGSYSRIIDVCTSSDVPGLPSVPRVGQRMADGLHLDWDPPEHDGGTAIRQYCLEIRSGAMLRWVVIRAQA